jgi:hypothetical protein
LDGYQYRNRDHTHSQLSWVQFLLLDVKYFHVSTETTNGETIQFSRPHTYSVRLDIATQQSVTLGNVSKRSPTYNTVLMPSALR